MTSAFDGKPVPANITVSVVDEMVYVLQPEIAPSIVDFFYHPRRNSVRTTSSLSFIGYDLAVSAQPGAGGPEQGRYNERGVKVLERPRRDEKDTAAWGGQPAYRRRRADTHELHHARFADRAGASRCVPCRAMAWSASAPPASVPDKGCI
ncbi:hypothetical protein ACU4GD_00755 [Cupriavidus basilensis]